MNINPISYAYRTQNYSFGKSLKKSSNNNEKTVDDDSKAKAEMYNYSDFSVKTILLSTLLASCLLCGSLPAGNAKLNNNSASQNNGNKISVSEQASIGNYSVDAIIPSTFNYLQENIKNLQQQLDSHSLDETETADVEKELDALYKKQEAQKNVARTYIDGKYVYIRININKDDEDTNNKYEFGINIESLKKLFDIEDGGIENNNELKVRDDAYGKYGDGTYKDYTQNWFHDGDIIKVPVSSIQLDNINLNGYYED